MTWSWTFYSDTKSLLLDKKYELWIRQQKACNRLCVQQSFEFLEALEIHASNMIQ